MNPSLNLLILEVTVLILGLAVLLLDLWTPPERKRLLGYGAASALTVIFCYSLTLDASTPQFAFGQSYVMDGLALFFKRFFLLAAIVVMVMSVAYADRIASGISEFYSLVLFALAGMMFAASANDFPMLFVSVEVITVTFYILISFQRNQLASLEAGIKYLILGALSTAFTIYGIALVYGASGTMSFVQLARVSPGLSGQPLFLLGLLLVLMGLGFKIAAFPMQIWAPDVYQGSPTPTTAFLSVGSKAAGFVLLLRLLFEVVPQITAHWTPLLIVLSAVTILYGNLCAIPQRNLKRLLGYSSIAHAGYLLVAITSHTADGVAAIVFYTLAYTLATIGAYAVLSIVSGGIEKRTRMVDLAGLSRTRPALAVAMAVFMLSLMGFPVAGGMGFFAKWYVLRAALASPAPQLKLAVILVLASLVSAGYYLSVIATMFMKPVSEDVAPAHFVAPRLTGGVIAVAAVLLLTLGIYPGPAIRWAKASSMPMTTARPTIGPASMQAVAPAAIQHSSQ